MKKLNFKNSLIKNEMVFYKDEDDLISKVLELKDDIVKINKISKNGRNKYFKIFNNSSCLKFIISKSFTFLNSDMHGKSKILCIAGKNFLNDCLSFLIKKYKGKIKILALPNKTDDGLIDGKKSFKKVYKKIKFKLQL